MRKIIRSTKIVPCLFFLMIIGYSCESTTETRDAVIGINENKDERIEDIMDFVDPDQPLAYIVEGELTIYIARGYEEAVAKALDANIENGIWLLKEENFAVKREPKELKWEDWYPRLAIIRWTYMRGFTCVEKPAGSWINITNKKNKFVRSYKTTEKDWWCQREVGQSCKVVNKLTPGDYYTKREGRGRKKFETRTLSACSP